MVAGNRLRINETASRLVSMTDDQFASRFDAARQRHAQTRMHNPSLPLRGAADRIDPGKPYDDDFTVRIGTPPLDAFDVLVWCGIYGFWFPRPPDKGAVMPVCQDGRRLPGDLESHVRSHGSDLRRLAGVNWGAIAQAAGGGKAGFEAAALALEGEFDLRAQTDSLRRYALYALGLRAPDR